MRGSFGLALRRAAVLEKGFRDGSLHRAKYDEHLSKVLGREDHAGDGQVDLSRMEEGWDEAVFSAEKVGLKSKPLVRDAKAPELLAKLGWSDSRYHRTLFFKVYPSLRGKVWVHHAVEKQILKQYPGLFQLEEVQSFENLRGIPSSLNRKLHLSEIRMRWNSFYKRNRNPTREDVLRYAAAIDSDLGGGFNPPL